MSIPVCEVHPVSQSSLTMSQEVLAVPEAAIALHIKKSLSLRSQASTKSLRSLKSQTSEDLPTLIEKSLTLRSQASWEGKRTPSRLSRTSSGSLHQLLAKEASQGLEGDITPAVSSDPLQLTVLPSKPSEKECMMDVGEEEEDAVVVVPKKSSDDGEDGEVAKKKDEEEEMSMEEEPMDADESELPSTSTDAVASGSGITDAPAGPTPYTGPAPIEIIISFDTTGSMSYYLDEVKAKIQEIIQRLFMDIPNLKIGVMAHGDYCDEKVFYLMQKVDFTNDVNSLCTFVKDVEGTGGGDFEECYEWVLSQVRKLDWTPGTQRSLIMIGDAIPHEPDYGLNKENLNWRTEADDLYNEQGVRVYAVQCQNEKGAANFWKDLANRTQGRHLKLDQFSSIVDILMAICYREHSTEYFEAYEKEVRSRVGPHIVPELDNAFDVLRGGPSKKKFDISTVDFSKGASKKKATAPRPNPRPAPAKRTATAVVKKVVAKNDADLPSTSAGSVAHRVRQPVKKLDVAAKKVAKAVTKARQGKKEVEKKQKVERVRKTAGARITRETVPCSRHVLNGLQWSPWKLAMCQTAPDERSIWQERKNGTAGGVKHVGLFSRSSDKPAIYEFAVHHSSSRKKYVVYSRSTHGFTDKLWDAALLGGKNRLQDEIEALLLAGCELFIRRALIKPLSVDGKTLKSPREFSAVLRSRYDYAWRFMKRAGSMHVSHRQVEIRAGIAASRDTIRKCTCVMCS